MDYFEDKFIEDNFIEPILGLNPRPEFINNHYSKKQMKKDVDKAKEEDYQILNSEMQNVIANLKYIRDLGEEIEKLQ